MDNTIDKLLIVNQEYDLCGVNTNTPYKKVDFAISDEFGNAILELKGGHIKTKEFDSRTPQSSTGNMQVRMERGNIDVNGYDTDSINDYANYVKCSYYLNIEGATAFRVVGQNNYTLLQYNSNHEVISVSSVSDGVSQIAAGCVYVRFVIHTNDVAKDLSVLTNARLREEKRVQLRAVSERLVFQVDGDVCTTSRLMLPPNYSINGKPVPVVMWDNADGGFRDWNLYDFNNTYAGVVNGLSYLRDQGFAIFEVYSWCSHYNNEYPDCGGRGAMPIPTHIKAHDKGIEYILDRFNLDKDNIFEMSWSGSGKYSLYLALEKQKFNIKSIYAFAPVFDDLSVGGSWGMIDYRKALYEELNMDGTADQIRDFLTYTPLELGGNNKSWLYNCPPKTVDQGGSGDVSPDDPNFIANLKSNQDFIRNNIEKFTCICVNWRNSIGQTIDNKLNDSLQFTYDFWFGGKEYNDPTHEEDIYNHHDMAMIGSHVPFSVIMSKNDGSCPYWCVLETVNQLRNGGCDAKIMYTASTGGHTSPCNHIPSTDGIWGKGNIDTRLGIHYSGVAIGWYLACEDIYSRFLNQSGYAAECQRWLETHTDDN